MTIQNFASFEAETAQPSATSKLVKAWEAKNAKRAVKASGATLMALSLSACGSDDNTPYGEADISAAKVTALTTTGGTVYASVDAAVTAGAATVDITTDNADAAAVAVTAALTTADGTVTYATVDAAIEAARTEDVSDAVAAAEAAILGDYATAQELIESNDAAVEAAATDAAEEALLVGTGFASVADLLAAYNDASGAPTPLAFTLTTGADVVQGFTTGNDSVTGTQATLASTDVMVDSNSGDNDTVTINSTTADLSVDANAAAITPVMNGIENVVFNFTTFGEGKIDASNIASGEITMNQLQVGGSTAATVNDASGVTVTAGTGITGTFTVNVDDLAETTVINAGNAATVTQTVDAGDAKAVNVTINGSATSTSLTGDSGNLGTTTIVGTATDVTLVATGGTVNVTSAYEGTSTTASSISITGGSAADVANVTLGGIVTLGNAASIEQTNLTTFAASTVTLTEAVEKLDLAGTHNTTIVVDTVADVSGKTITTSGTGSYTVRVTGDIGGAIDASKFDADMTLRLDDFDDTDTVTIDSGATIDYREGTSQVLELVSSAAAGTTAESITVISSVAASEITNGTAGTGAGTDRFETVNIQSGATTATTVQAILGDAALTTAGTAAVTVGATSTAASVTNNGVATTVEIDGTGDITKIYGSATATDTIKVTANTGDDLSAFTLSNIDVIELSAAADYTLVVNSAQVSGKSIAITGNTADANDAISVVASESTVDLSSLNINTAGITDLTVDLTATATTTQTITGSNTVDKLTGQGAGAINVDGKGGADVLVGGTGNDTLTGGEGGDTLTGGDGNDTFILTEATAAQDTVIVEWAAGELETVTGFGVGSAATADLLHFTFADAAGTVTDLKDATDTAQGDAPLLQKIALGTAFDLGTSTANSNVMVFDGNIADAATLATALNDGGSTELKMGGVVGAGDSFFALYDNGTSTFFAEISTALGAADDAAATDLVVTNLVQFTDIADATTVLAANLDFI